jgi:hypothetical protein
MVRQFMLSSCSPPGRYSLHQLRGAIVAAPGRTDLDHKAPLCRPSYASGRSPFRPVLGLAVQTGNATGQARNVNAVASGLSSVGTRRGSGRSWKRLGRGGLRARCRSCAACRSYPSAANCNYQGGSTTEQRQLDPSLSFHLTSLSRFGPIATIRGMGQHP